MSPPSRSSSLRSLPCITVPSGGTANPGLVLSALLAVQQDLHASDDDSENVGPSDPRGPLFRAIVQNQAFANRPTEGSLIARLQTRWRELPPLMKGHPEWVDLEAEFERSTGTTLTDLTVVGLGLWAGAQRAPGRVMSVSYFDSLRWPRERLEAALRLVAADPATLASAVEIDDATFGLAWSFDAFRQYPVIRLEGDRLFILSPSFLVARLFGWLPLYDLREALRGEDKKRLAARSVGFFRAVCEEQVLESLTAIVGETPFARRLFRQSDLKTAFSYDQKTADAAIDCGSAWIVVEVSTHQLKRPAVVGGSAVALEEDFRIGIDEKVQQLDSTIRALQADESRLTGTPSVAGRRFVPVLVLTEGFPVNPMTYEAIEGRLRGAGLLRGPRVGPLHILDQEELEPTNAIPRLVASLEACRSSPTGPARAPFQTRLARRP